MVCGVEQQKNDPDSSLRENFMLPLQKRLRGKSHREETRGAKNHQVTKSGTIRGFVMTMKHTSLLLLAVFLINGCSESLPESHPISDDSPPPPDLFDTYLDTDFPPADGFDFPVGDVNGEGSYRDNATGKEHNGWYVATKFAEEYRLGIHPGEDWNGNGGGSTDLGQPVRSVADGRVVTAKDFGRLWGKVIMIEHLYYENHHKRTIHSVYAHLDNTEVKPGEIVKRRQEIGTIGQDPDKLYPPHLHLELRNDLSLSPTYWPSSDGKDIEWVKGHYLSPSRFIRSHRKLFVPQKEKRLVLIDHETYRMKLFKQRELIGEYDVNFGQGTGRKRVEGDNNTPKGMYFVIEKEKGEIPGKYGAYFGGHWIKVNYPNAFDAAWGRANGKISERMEKEIASAWRERKPTSQGTSLGGGIGLHGWIREWEDEGSRRLSWGCVVLHNRDIGEVYRQLPIGAMVVVM